LDRTKINPEGLAIGTGQLHRLDWFTHDVLQQELGGLHVAAACRFRQLAGHVLHGLTVNRIEQRLA
jgi:hypothetical protein